MRSRRGRWGGFMRLVVAGALVLPMVVSVRGGAAIQGGCILRGGFLFETSPNQFGRYPVLLDVAGNCFDQRDLERDIPIRIRVFLVGTAGSLGRCTAGPEIDDLDLNGFYHSEVEGEAQTVNIEAEEWELGRYPFPGPTPFKLMLRYDGTQASSLPIGGVFAAGFVTTRVFGMCPNQGDPNAHMRLAFSRRP